MIFFLAVRPPNVLQGMIFFMPNDFLRFSCPVFMPTPHLCSRRQGGMVSQQGRKRGTLHCESSKIQGENKKHHAEVPAQLQYIAVRRRDHEFTKKAKTKHSKIYNSFLDRGFTLKSLINDDKLIDCFIEDKTILPFIHWGNLNINKKIIKEGIRKLRNILNKKSFPVWLLLLIIISVLFIIKKRIP